ncbi:MAG: dihydroorotase [Alphaproteobacteria bacterium]
MTRTLSLPTPDDLHLHLRDGAVLRAVLPPTARVFARAIVMPNLTPPVVTTADALAYRERITAALPAGAAFTPLMTAYLTDATDPEDLAHGFAEGIFTAAKLYPAHATTNSAAGVTDIRALAPVFERMQQLDMVLCIHGEVTRADVDIFDREAVFVDEVLAPLRRDFPELRIVLEHVTTAHAAAFVESQDERLAATITPQHLLFERNAMLVGGIRPHLYCLPILKRRRDREALRRVVATGSPKFFLGTDSAPHPRRTKESACGCAGVFSAPVALEAYATAFDAIGCLDRLADFAARFGRRFYGLAPNPGTVTLEATPWRVPERVAIDGADDLRPLFAGEELRWRVR